MLLTLGLDVAVQSTVPEDSWDSVWVLEAAAEQTEGLSSGECCGICNAKIASLFFWLGAKIPSIFQEQAELSHHLSVKAALVFHLCLILQSSADPFSLYFRRAPALSLQ